MSTDAPSRAEEVTRKRLVLVTIGDDRFQCKRLTVRELMQVDALVLPLSAGVSKVLIGRVTNVHDVPIEDREAARVVLERIAIAAAIEPRISPNYPAPDAVPVRLLLYDDLIILANEVLGTSRLMGAAEAETFRGTGGAEDAAATPDGQSLRSAAEQPGLRGSVDLGSVELVQH